MFINYSSYIEKEKKFFYYNIQSKTSQWEHPLDEYYRQIVEKTRSEDSSTGKLKKNDCCRVDRGKASIFKFL